VVSDAIPELKARRSLLLDVFGCISQRHLFRSNPFISSTLCTFFMIELPAMPMGTPAVMTLRPASAPLSQYSLPLQTQ
jgi:hypothetical protein